MQSEEIRWVLRKFHRPARESISSSRVNPASRNNDIRVSFWQVTIVTGNDGSPTGNWIVEDEVAA